MWCFYPGEKLLGTSPQRPFNFALPNVLTRHDTVLYFRLRLLQRGDSSSHSIPMTFGGSVNVGLLSRPLNSLHLYCALQNATNG